MALVDPEIIFEQSNIKRTISTDKAPAAIGPYSQAVQAGEFLYASGQIPVDPATGSIPESVSAQAERSLENLKAVIEAGGYLMTDVVKTTVFAADIKDFNEINAVYAKFFPREAPARSFVAVKDLPKGVKIEVEAVAWHRK